MSTVLAFKSRRRNSPTVVNGKVVPPHHVAKLKRRSREHLKPTEVDCLIAAAGKVGRHGLRDGLLILLAYRHGLRVSELVALRWADKIKLQRVRFGERATTRRRCDSLLRKGTKKSFLGGSIVFKPTT